MTSLKMREGGTDGGGGDVAGDRSLVKMLYGCEVLKLKR
jgi:hypothetical protein